MIEIRLKPSEIHHAANVGVLRMLNVIARERNDPHGGGIKNEWQRHITGALGEYVISKHTGVFWNPNVGTINHAADVGLDDVRLTTNPGFGLKVQKSDPDDRKCWSVYMNRDLFVVRGWAFYHEGKKAEYWAKITSTYSSYVIPVDKLHAPTDTGSWSK